MNFKAIGQFVKQQFVAGSLFTKIIIIQLCLYALVLIFKILSLLPLVPTDWFFSFLYNYVVLPPHFSKFGIKFYTLLSYQFIHLDFFHFLSNVIVLFFFANFIKGFYSIKQSFPLFILGGIVSGLFAMFLNNFNNHPDLFPIVGASGSIMALLGAVTFLSPNYTFTFFGLYQLKLKYISGAIFILNFLLLFFASDFSSAAVHVGGLLFGYAFAFLNTKGFDLAKPFNLVVEKLLILIKPAKNNFVKPNNVSKSKEHTESFDMDAILDKISKMGYAALTKQEKDFLFKNNKE